MHTRAHAHANAHAHAHAHAHAQAQAQASVFYGMILHGAVALSNGFLHSRSVCQ